MDDDEFEKKGADQAEGNETPPLTMEITPRYINLSEESVAEFKGIFKKPDSTTFPDEEAHEAAQSLIGFFDFLLRLDERNKRE